MKFLSAAFPQIGCPTYEGDLAPNNYLKLYEERDSNPHRIAPTGT